MKTSGKACISLDTRIKVLLEADQKNVIEALVELNANFAKLRNPILRKLFAPRVSIADACSIAKCESDAFFRKMAELGFEIEANLKSRILLKQETPEQSEPEVSEGLKDENAAPFYKGRNVVVLDVRPSLAASQDPLKMILKAVKELMKDDCLKIVNTFEPVPLIELLADQGFSHYTERKGQDLVMTWFAKTEGSAAVHIPVPGEGSGYLFDAVLLQYGKDQIRYLNVRQLEIPLPMLTIMEHIEQLNECDLLYVYHKKLPVFLLPELEKRGFSYAFKRKSNVELDLLIFR